MRLSDNHIDDEDRQHVAKQSPFRFQVLQKKRQGFLYIELDFDFNIRRKNKGRANTIEVPAFLKKI